MEIRKTKLEDIPRLQEVFTFAKKQMRADGNLDQWIGYPTDELLQEDIAIGRGYAILNDAGEIIGTFVFFIGDDPTYTEIYDGKWPSSTPYGVIHRIASDGSQRGILNIAMEFALKQISTIRIDTYEENLRMQHVLLKYGFVRCGNIFLKEPHIKINRRIAFQYDAK